MMNAHNVFFLTNFGIKLQIFNMTKKEDLYLLQNYIYKALLRIFHYL